MNTNDFEKSYKDYLKHIKEAVKKDKRYVFSPQDAKQGVKNSRCATKLDDYEIVIEEIREEARQNPLSVKLTAFTFFLQKLNEMNTDPNQKSTTEFRKKYESYSGVTASQMADFKLPVYKDFMNYVKRMSEG